MLRIVITGLAAMMASAVIAQDAGQKLFTDHCATCHGTDGNGGELGPNIATRVPLRSDEELANVVRQGLGAAGMPAFPAISESDMPALIGKLRSLRLRFGAAPERREVTLANGSTI